VLAALEVLASPDALPAVFHCTAGKDRTGVLSAIVLSLLGVDEPTVVADYALSGAAMLRLRAKLIQKYPEGRETIENIDEVFSADPAQMEQLLDHIQEQYGSVGATFTGTTVNIAQFTSKAILNWANFNIANGYTVNFIQPSATAAVLNDIWSANPSVIAGRLNANGQVYLINQNGIVFDKGAQINVAGLTASTLTLPSSTFEDGILAANTASTAPAVFVAPPNGTAGAVDVDADQARRLGPGEGPLRLL